MKLKIGDLILGLVSESFAIVTDVFSGDDETLLTIYCFNRKRKMKVGVHHSLFKLISRLKDDDETR